jgi:hypothetical protein
MNLNELRDFKLTLDEWNLIPGIGAGHMTYERNQAHVDMLVLAGLVEHTDAESLALTPDGEAAAAAIDMIFDWEEFAHVEGAESPSKALAEAATVELPAKPAERPKPLSVGSLVRHIPTGGIGLITKHTMYDARWGGFYVDFVKPVDNVIDGRVVNKLSVMFDRGDKFEAV